MKHQEWIRVLCTAVPLPMANAALLALIEEWGGTDVHVPALSKAERIEQHERIFAMIEEGLDNAGIAERLNYSIRHVQRLRQVYYSRRRRSAPL